MSNVNVFHTGETFQDHAFQSMMPFVGILLDGIESINPQLRLKLKDYYELVRCVNTAHPETIKEIMKLLKQEQLLNNISASIISKPGRCQIFLDLLRDKGIEIKLHHGIRVNTKVEELIGK